MEYQEKVEITLNIPKELFDKVSQYVSYKNTFNLLHKTKDQPFNEENFIIGAIKEQIETIENYHPVAINKTISFDDLKLQNNIGGFLKRNKIKQIDLAEWTQIDPTSISLIVKNRNQPTVDHFLRIWTVLDFPKIDELFYRVPK
jgi:hypothetical protein